MSSQVLRTEPLGLRVLQDGDGPDVLLIGGLADDTSTWDHQSRALAGDYRVTRYDARGTASAPSPPGPYAQAALVGDALAVLDAAQIEIAHVVGTGLGGVIAQKLAVFHPERVASLTLSASWARPDRALRARYAHWRWAAQRASSVTQLLTTVYSATYGADAWNSGEVDRRLAAAESAELSDAGRAWGRTRDAFIWTSLAALERDTRDALASVASPALIVAGASDPVVGVHHGRQLAALLRDSRLEVIADAGHRPHEEQPGAFNELLETFLVSASAREAVSI